MSYQKLDSHFDFFISEMKNTLGHNCSAEIFDQLGIKIQENRELSPMNVLKICNSLNVSFDAVFSKNIDFKAMKSQFFGGCLMPERFKMGYESSSRFTTIYMMNFISEKFGKQARDILMKHLQITSQNLQDRTEWNNLLLSYEICEYVKRYFGKEMVVEMGESSIRDLSHRGLFNSKDKQSVVTMFDKFFTEISPSQVERNYHWKIEKNIDDSVYISGTPNREVLNQFGAEIVASEGLASLRSGFLKAMPEKILGVKTSAELITSFQHGGEFDLYKIECRPLDEFILH